MKEDELKILNNLVSGYFDFAEIQAMKHHPMYMSDYIKQLDNILSSTGVQLLSGAGKVSHSRAMSKAESEYRKYELRTLSPDYFCKMVILLQPFEKHLLYLQCLI